ncbi:MAG: aldose epimerase family protein, partial [bacterium]
MRKVNKDELKTYSLTNDNNCSVKITNFGASVMSLKVPDKNGRIGDVVLGYETPEEYIEGNPYFGATIGRYANRICKGTFILDGKEYTLPINNGNNHLHGGPQGFHNLIWTVKDYRNDNDQHFIELEYVSKDGEQGYPGQVTVTVKYTLTEKNELVIDYEAVTDKKTIINLTHHSFFNLKDGGESTILNHKL